MMFQVRQTGEDTTYLITAKHFGQCLVLFGTCDSAVILTLPTFHSLVVELVNPEVHLGWRANNNGGGNWGGLKLVATDIKFIGA